MIILYVAHEAPHVPFQGRNDPAYRFPDEEFTYHGPVEDRKATYREMVEVMDEGIGKIKKTNWKKTPWSCFSPTTERWPPTATTEN